MHSCKVFSLIYNLWCFYFLTCIHVCVYFLEPPEITISPIREVQLNLGQNYTLKCNASGDPHPNITWTKDGVPASQFNASGYLHLVNVQREDAGSYICTASNGFGDNDTAISIINIKCKYYYNKISFSAVLSFHLVGTYFCCICLKLADWA